MVEANRFRLGLFVVVGGIIFLICLFVFGLSDIFAKKVKLVTLFNESVQGLAPGSPVKYKGAVIGNVSKVTIRIKDKLIRVDMDINPDNLSLNNSQGRHWRKQFYDFFRQEIKRGLQCRLEYAGITGMKYVDLDYYPNNATNNGIKPPPDIGDNFIYIPSQPSMLNDMLTLVSNSLEKISKIKIDKISDELSVTITNLQKLLENPKLVKTIEQFERASANIENTSAEFSKIVTEKRVEKIITRWNHTLDSVDALLAATQEQLKNANIKATSAEFIKAATALTSLKSSISDSLEKLDLMLNAVTELSRFLESDPAAIIQGKSATPLTFPLKPQPKNRL